MVCKWSILTHQFWNFESFLIIFGHNIDDSGNCHVFGIKSTLVFLYSQLVTLAIFVDSLLDYKFCDFSIFFGDVVPNDIWTSAFQPSITPFFKVDWTFALDGSLVHVSDEVAERGVLEAILLEVRRHTCLENLSAEESENLVEPGSSFTVGDAIEHVLGSLSMNYFHRNGMRRVFLIRGEPPERLVQEHAPCSFVVFGAFTFV